MNDNIETQITEYESREYIEERNDIEGNPNDENVDDYDTVFTKFIEENQIRSSLSCIDQCRAYLLCGNGW